MKKTVLSFGLIAGTIVCAMMVYSTSQCYLSETWEPSEVLGYAGMLAAFSFIFVGVRSYRDNYNGGVITFGKAFRTGLYITLVASAMYVVVWVVDYYVFMPDFMDRYAEYVLEKARREGRDPAELADEIAMYKTIAGNPLLVVLTTFAEVFPVGLLISLASAAILKRRKNYTTQTN